jgi:hypothetical protein
MTNNYEKPERDLLEAFVGITIIQSFLNQLEVMLQNPS